MINGQVGSGVGGTLVARAPVPVLTTPCPEHSRTEALPGPRAVQGVVAAAVRLPSVRRAAATGPAGDDATHRAELHGSARSGAGTVAARLTLVTLDCTPFDIASSVRGVGSAVYSPAVLHLQGQPRRFVSYWVVRLETHDPFIVLTIGPPTPSPTATG